MSSTKPKARTGMSTLEDHPDHVRAIGMISIENANLEHMLASLFSRMLSIQLAVGHAIYLTPKSAIARIDSKMLDAQRWRPGVQMNTKKGSVLR